MGNLPFQNDDDDSDDHHGRRDHALPQNLVRVVTRCGSMQVVDVRATRKHQCNHVTRYCEGQGIDTRKRNMRERMRDGCIDVMGLTGDRIRVEFIAGVDARLDIVPMRNLDSGSFPQLIEFVFFRALDDKTHHGEQHLKSERYVQ